MRSRYDGNPGKDSAIANTRQKRLESEHSRKDAFVKKQQAELSRMGAKAPNLKPESMHFNAYMCNDGAHAQELGKKLTSGIDHVAFPVDGEGNDS
jgi:hypothetical protein